MSTVESELRQIVAAITPRLLALPDSEAGKAPLPGKWSPKQVIGHLIDSASNNHQRFVRAQFKDDLIFPGYEQDAWVEAQRYDSAPWPELVGLWQLYNLHLARLIEATPASIRLESRDRHNLHELAWQPIPERQTTTLEYFMADYVEHLKHHLAQVLGSRSL
jgi:hypothetical protein